MAQPLRSICDSCQAEFQLSLEWLGRTVQCGRCRNYFVVVPASNVGGQALPQEPAKPFRVQVRSAIHLLPRAWLSDWHQLRWWYVRYPVGWLQLAIFALALLICAAHTFILLGLLVAVWVVAPQGMLLEATVLGVVLVVLGLAVYHPLSLLVRACVPSFQTVIYADFQNRPAPAFLIRPVSFAHWIFGRWVIESIEGELLAELRRTGWLKRLLTRRRWTMHVPQFPAPLVIEESVWLPQAVRYILLLPLGILRLAWLFTPWFLKPFRPTYRVRLEGSQYILAENHTQLSWRDMTQLELTPGAEQLLDWRLLRALAALLHGDA